MKPHEIKNLYRVTSRTSDRLSVQRALSIDDFRSFEAYQLAARRIERLLAAARAEERDLLH